MGYNNGDSRNATTQEGTRIQMTRQYMNDRWCVRCGRESPTPYVRDNYKKLQDDWLQHTKFSNAAVLDLGCGNGRNINFLHTQGMKNLVAFDHVDDFGHPFTLGQKPLPMFNRSVDLILANYVFMFLNKKERKQVYKDIRRIANNRCVIMIELYPALDSEVPTEETMLKLQKEIFDALGWEKLRYSKGRFIAQRS